MAKWLFKSDVIVYSNYLLMWPLKSLIIFSVWVVVGRAYKTRIQGRTVHKAKPGENKYPEAAVKTIESPIDSLSMNLDRKWIKSSSDLVQICLLI